MTARNLISIIVPMYNEEGNVTKLFERLGATISEIRSRWGYQVEVIINDNCSTDDTFEELQRYAATYNRSAYKLRIFRFSRNIGFQNSILVGYYKAAGDSVVQIDADLQDPPELILDFIEKWREGNAVVYGVRKQRKEGASITFMRWLFYRFIRQISKDDLPADAGDFRLVDRKLVDVICSLRDFDPYLRGALANLGLSQVGVPYERDARNVGETSFRLGDLIKLSMDGISNHSVAPLRFAIYAAFGIALLMACLILFYFFGWLAGGDDLPKGFLTSTLLQLAGVGALSFLIGVQGEYIGRIFRQLKERPLAIIESRLEVESDLEDSAIPKPTIEVMWFGNGDTVTPGRVA